MCRPRAAALLAIVCMCACSGGRTGGARAPGGEPPRPSIAVEPVPEKAPPMAPGHPRLWITADDLPRLRRWATDANPMWGPIASLRDELIAELESGKLDCLIGWRPCEVIAELFAFLSLVAPSESERMAHAMRAKGILLSVLREVEKGREERHPIRGEGFPTDDRARWGGEAFPVTVDWIYPYLSAEEKASIRRIFLRWARERLTATVTTDNHPEPVGVVNSPELVADRGRVRFAGNNYFTSHMRLNGLAALVFDAVDDPDGELRAYLDNAVGAWMYMVDHLMRTDAAGGLMPEGFEYAPQTAGYVAQLLLALETSGEGKRFGKLGGFDGNPFWDDLLAIFPHTLAPRTVEHEWQGAVWQPAWYGDGQQYLAADFIDLFGPLGVHHARAGDAARLEAIRWLQKHTPPGGAEEFPRRVKDVAHVRQAIWYFLLYDPAAGEPRDPRPAQPTARLAPGIGHLYARTGWDRDATWLTYKCGWLGIDHQHGEGNQLELYRRGEWLIKELTGYGNEIAMSEHHNTLALENGKPHHDDPSDYRYPYWKNGSQWLVRLSSSPCRLLGHSLGEKVVHATGDATGLYNSDYEEVRDVAHASRSLVWLKPDHVVVMDRAASRVDGRFKRFWLSLPAPARVAGRVATVVTPGKQRLFVTSVLPADAVITAEPYDPKFLEDQAAEMEPMKHRLRVESRANPREVRFLHVLQGSSRETPDAVTKVESVAGARMVGVVVRGTAVLFPLGEPLLENREITYRVPSATAAHVVTGLVPGGGYAVTTKAAGAQLEVSVRPGGDRKADGGGVLAWGL